jgi:dTDP-glucose 4,6-dehydratase
LRANSIIVTGGAGFIGSAVVRALVRDTDADVVTVDKLTYAGHRASLAEVLDSPRHRFELVDIVDADKIRALFAETSPTAVIHLAAESHVDRSIDGPSPFISTNLVGTSTLLEESLRYWTGLPAALRESFRFLHVSTDEVFGSLGTSGAFTEETAYSPRSPYAASKAGADHLVRAWQTTYGLPTLITNCSNNYGPYQFPEKLVPTVIRNALIERPIPVYGSGENVRDWIHVDDHVAAIRAVMQRGVPGETYTIGARCERTNLEIVELICDIVDRSLDDRRVGQSRSLITFVSDRPGHDLRYAIDPSKIERDLGWRTVESLRSGLEKTVAWYLANEAWCREVTGGSYTGERLGLERTR